MPRRARRPVQLELPRHAGWGGRRKGAGRKPSGEKALVTHAGRPALAPRFPVHVTLRVLPHVWNLRSKRGYRVVRRALAAGGDRFGMRLCEFSVQGNHLHFVVEAEDARALSRGMQGLSIRLAKGLNRMMSRGGKVLTDRFHARILRTPTEVSRVLAYVRGNHDVHRARRGARPTNAADVFSSAVAAVREALPAPRTYLLDQARRALDGPDGTRPARRKGLKVPISSSRASA